MPSDENINYRNLTFAEVAQFLTEKNISHKCSSCSDGVNVILSEPDKDTISLYGMHSIIAEEMPLITVNESRIMLSVVTECANCGYRKHFASRMIFKWLESRGLPTT